MAYEQRNLRRQKVRYDSKNDDNLIVYQCLQDAEKVTPASATIAVTAPGDSSVTLSADAMTVSGTLLTYALDTTTESDYPASSGWRGDIIITDGTPVTHDRHIIFDIEAYPLFVTLGRDQLFDRDENLLAAEHGGDEDMSGFIEACWDELQLLLETKALGDDQLRTHMILDNSRIAIPHRLYCLWQFWLNRDPERGKRYEQQFERMWKAFLHGIKYDKAGSGSEDSKQGGIVQQRLYT